MKPLCVFIILVLSLTAYAQERQFLGCQGNLNTSVTLSESGSKNVETNTNEKISTEIVIDKSKNNLHVQFPIMNFCESAKSCQCIFNNDSYSCSTRGEVGTDSSPLYVSTYWKIEISRKTGIALFTGLFTEKIQLTTYINQKITTYTAPMQCAVVVKNIF